MSTATSAGVDYSVPPNTQNSGSNNDGGSATKIGSSSVLNNVAVSRDTTGVFGSTVIDGDDTDKAISGGVFAHDHVKPIAGRITTEIAGVNSTVLATNANNPTQLRSINKRESIKSNGVATAIRQGYWNIYSGTWTTNPTPVTVATTGVPTTGQPQAGNDDAATPTREAPGELVFKTGAKLPVRDKDYKPKNG